MDDTDIPTKQIFMLFAALASIFLVSVTSFTERCNATESPQNRFLPLRQTGTLLVQNVVDPLRVQLSDQSIVHLTGIDIPDLTPYKSGPIAEQAQKALNELIKNNKVRLYQNRDKNKGFKNRFGHLLAHLETSPENIWVQGYLLEKGLARVRPSADNLAMAEQMLAAEEKARQENLGLWNMDEYKILKPEDAETALHSWGIIEGTVHSSAIVKNKTYLNFGADWKNDFTITIPAAVRKQMVRAGTNPLSLTHKKLRVRGWLESYNGPYIELMHATWLQVLPDREDQPIVKQDNN